MILHHYNPDFQVEDFFRIIDFMPYIVKLTFQGDKLMDLSEEFYLQKICLMSNLNATNFKHNQNIVIPENR